MLGLFCLVSILIVPFNSKCRLEAENVALRHQVIVLRRQLGAEFILRTSIGYSSSSFTIGFHRSGECSPSFSRRPLFAGIVSAFATIGVGNHALGTGGRRSARSCARHRGHGLIYCPDHWLRPALCPRICNSRRTSSPLRSDLGTHRHNGS